MDHEVQPCTPGSCLYDASERLNDAEVPTLGSDERQKITLAGHCDKSEDTKVAESTTAPVFSSNTRDDNPDVQLESQHVPDCSCAIQGSTGERCETGCVEEEAIDSPVDVDDANTSVALCSKTSERVNPGLAVVSSADIVPIDADIRNNVCMASHSEVNVDTEAETTQRFLEKTHSDMTGGISDVVSDSSNEQTQNVSKELTAEKLNTEMCSVLVDNFESEDKRFEIAGAAAANLEVVNNEEAVSGSQSLEVNVKNTLTISSTERIETRDGKVELESSNKFTDQEIKDESIISSLEFSLKKSSSLIDDTEANKAIDQVCVAVDNSGCLSSRVIASTTVVDACESSLLASAVPIQCGNPINTKTLTPKHFKGKKKRGNDFKMESKPRPYAENEALSSVVQVQHGPYREKDGGSSVDSTAGSGWKTKESSDQMGTEDVNSSGGEDSASSPACLQPSQRRKKINIHHQFVREIVKIQHDREQYDKEQVERHIQVQQTAGLVQSRSKNPENKESKAKTEEKKHIANDSQSTQKQVDSHSNETESQQKHNARSKRSSFHQSNKVFKQALNVSFSQKDNVLGMGIGRLGRGKQRAISIYQPPVARESVPGALDERNVADVADCSYNRSATDVNNSSDGSTGSVSESILPSAEASNSLKDEGRLKVVKSSSGERYVHFIESQAESTMPEMNIKVIFDTQRKLRHIELSELRDGQDSTTDLQQNNCVGTRSSRNPASPHVRHDSLLVSSPVINKRQMQGLPKGIDQSDKGSWSESYLPLGSPKFQDKMREGKGAQLDHLHKSSLGFQKGSANFNSGVNEDSQTTHFSDTSSIGAKPPSSFVQGFRGSSSRNFSSHKMDQSIASSPNDLLRSMDALSLSVDVKTAMQTLQPNRLESRTDARGRQKSIGSASSGRKKRESHNRIKESRLQSFPSESPIQVLGEMNVGVQSLSMHLSDVIAHKSVKGSQPDMSWNAPSPSFQPQMSPSPSKDNIFSSAPVSGKWGDIVDEFPDYNDYSEITGIGEQGDNPISSLQSSFGLTAKQGSTAGMRFSRENSVNRGPRAEDGNFQRSNPSVSEVTKETPASETPARKSVWERLGPQNFKGSILGPPPKISDNWNVLRPFPQVNTQVNTSSSLLGGIDAAGLHGSLENNAGSVSIDEGLEVVVQAYTDMKQKRSKRELYVPRRGL